VGSTRGVGGAAVEMDGRGGGGGSRSAAAAVPALQLSCSVGSLLHLSEASVWKHLNVVVVYRRELNLLRSVALLRSLLLVA
jgi:hypothetical protein